MFSNIVYTAIAALPMIASAAPTATPAPIAYAYKTKVTVGNKALDGLYVTPYHTGAGLNDVTLTPKEIVKGYTTPQGQQIFQAGAQNYSLQLTQPIPNTDWARTTLNIGEQKTGAFYMNETTTSLWYNSQGTADNAQKDYQKNTFQGFQACFWSHQEEGQLFYRVRAGNNMTENCARVDIVIEK